MSVFLTPEEHIKQRSLLIVKKIGNQYKSFWLPCVRIKGYEKIPSDDDSSDDINVLSNSEKLINNICRAKSNVYELAMCNEFEYFVTFTLDKLKYNRHDLKKFMKDLTKAINNYNSYYHVKIIYLLIPEMHKDGAWHLHGLIGGIRQEDLFINSNGYLDFRQYSKKFGFCSLSKIKDKEAVSKYITKYITKELLSLPYGQHTYYHSQGLHKADVLYRISDIDPSSIDWDYIHPDKFCRIKTTENLDFLENLVLLR